LRIRVGKRAERAREQFARHERDALLAEHERDAQAAADAVTGGLDGIQEPTGNGARRRSGGCRVRRLALAFPGYLRSHVRGRSTARETNAAILRRIAPGKEAVMKKKLAATVVAVLAVGLSAATAQPASASGGSTRVAIEPVAQYDVLGFMIHVELLARCVGGGVLQLVQVDVTQSQPETPAPVGMGSGFADVVCDGRTHEVAVTINGEGFDAGTAFAEATLFAGGSTATDARQIDIRV
jgi:hypothetical protein